MRTTTHIALTTALVAALLVSVVAEVWALPTVVNRIVATFPETAPIAVPSIIWSVIAIACWQAVAVICIRITLLVRDRKFDASAYGWLRAIAWCLVAYIALAVFAFIALTVLEWATAGAVVGLFASGVIAVALAVSVAYFLLTRQVAQRYVLHRS